MSLISIRDLRKDYQTREGVNVHALGPLSISVGAGEFISVLGPSGCGKSTLLGLLTGLIEPSDGNVSIAGAAPGKSHRDIGVVFQSPVLLPWRTIVENVLLPADVLNIDRSEARKRADSLLDMVGLSGFGQKYPRELSGGMQQRASIARALLHDPKVLLMDEPFGALDAMTRDNMNRELLNIWSAAAKTIVLVTHSIAEAVFLSNRVIVLTSRPGRVAEEVDVDLPYPRKVEDLASDSFGRYIRKIRQHFQA